MCTSGCVLWHRQRVRFAGCCAETQERRLRRVPSWLRQFLRRQQMYVVMGVVVYAMFKVLRLPVLLLGGMLGRSGEARASKRHSRGVGATAIGKATIVTAKDASWW